MDSRRGRPVSGEERLQRERAWSAGQQEREAAWNARHEAQQKAWQAQEHERNLVLRRTPSRRPALLAAAALADRVERDGVAALTPR
ncbi:hypothetical protein [Kitasatospora sp. NPDC048538]|uniref:hypothetical protein n=1 Tax=unclassified Kitasatospora TaxID=2633591 RepID=UPI0033ED18D2